MGGVPDFRNGDPASATRELPFADVGTDRRIELFRAVSHHCGMQHLLGLTRPVATDAELMTAARGGDDAALGLLLERYRPHLFATAIRLLGYSPDAEDAVQETCLAAMRHIGSVRDPDSVGAWLQAVVRRACLQHKRRRRNGGELLTDSLPDLLDHRPGPEDRIERLELRDWIWGALQRLPEPLRVSAMLRYFGSYDSYDEVAAILGVPIGTVRSRLSEAKVKLADALLASAGLINDEVRVRARARERFWNDEFQDVFRRGESSRFVSHFATDLLIGWSGGKMARGREHLVAEIEGDLAVGVRIDLERVMTNDGIAVVEGRFVNPPEAPDHCPPGVALVMFGDDDRTSAMRLHLAPRAPRPDED
jgi:RNA polymerase sigma factor (sigma-70 family)